MLIQVFLPSLFCAVQLYGAILSYTLVVHSPTAKAKSVRVEFHCCEVWIHQLFDKGTPQG